MNQKWQCGSEKNSKIAMRKLGFGDKVVFPYIGTSEERLWMK